VLVYLRMAGISEYEKVKKRKVRGATGDFLLVLEPSKIVCSVTFASFQTRPSTRFLTLLFHTPFLDKSVYSTHCIKMTTQI
jgi:hypothetical protein